MTEILILDYNRPNELKNLLNSLKENALFEKKIVVLNNGGDKYADKFLKEGLCDRVINNSINIGCGAGTVQLFSQCQSEFAFYIQVDHLLQMQLTQKHIDFFTEKIVFENNYYIDLAGNQGHGNYSERAQFIRRSDYLIAQKDFGGPGPLDNLKWTEESVQDYMKEQGLKFFSFYPVPNQLIPPFRDCGWDSARENPDGSKWLHNPDTKLLKCLNPPTEIFTFPPLDEEEWEMAINGLWPEGGQVPKQWKGSEFEVWNKIKT